MGELMKMMGGINPTIRNKGINFNSSVYFFTKAPPYVDYITYGDFLMIEILLDSPYNENEVEDRKQPL